MHVIIIVLAWDIPPATLSLSLSLGIALGIEGGPGGWSLNHALDLVQYPFHHSLSIAKALAGHLFNLSLHPIEMAMSKYLVRL
jgi:hypothetical protein